MKPTAPKELNVFLKLLAVLALGGVFFLLFFSFFARVGSGIFLFSGIIPVSAGYFFGSWGGLVGGLVIFPLNFQEYAKIKYGIRRYIRKKTNGYWVW